MHQLRRIARELPRVRQRVEGDLARYLTLRDWAKHPFLYVLSLSVLIYSPQNLSQAYPAFKIVRSTQTRQVRCFVFDDSQILFQLQRVFGVTNASHAHTDNTSHPSSSDGTHVQQITEEITVGPQANFTLLDQMSELKKTQSKKDF